MLYQLRKAADVCSTLWFACSYAAPTPNTYTPRSTHICPEHTTLEFTLQFSDLYAPDTPFAPRSTLITALNVCQARMRRGMHHARVGVWGPGVRRACL